MKEISTFQKKKGNNLVKGNIPQQMSRTLKLRDAPRSPHFKCPGSIVLAICALPHRYFVQN